MIGTRKKFLLRLVVGVLIFLCSLGVFAFLAHEVVVEGEDFFDERTFTFLSKYSSANWIRFMSAISFFGSHLFLLPANIALSLILAFKKQWQDLFVAAFMSLSTFLLMLLLKRYFQRDRPSMYLEEVVSSFSFPSGHTVSFFVFALVIVYLILKSSLSKNWKMVISLTSLLLALLVGLSRIVLRVHFASDVLAGFSLGIAWSIFIAFLYVCRKKVT